jgi:UDP-N-acetyl-D-glucosamine dehydrogenase
MVQAAGEHVPAVNIGLVNEIALMSHRMNIDVWEVIEAASTKPFGFIAVLSRTRARRSLHSDRIPSTSRGRRGRPDSNAGSSSWPATSTGRLPAYVVDRIGEALNSQKKSINGSQIHIFGVATRRTLATCANHAALDVPELLHRRGAVLSYTDPHVPTLEHGELSLKSVDEAKAAKGYRLRGHLHEPHGVQLRRDAEELPAGRGYPQRV